MKNSEMNEESGLNIMKTGIAVAARQKCILPADFCGCAVQLDKVPVRDQKKTGRCWLEAGLGDMEYRIRRNGRVMPELSAGYLAYHDLRWKVRVFLQQIVNTRELPVDNMLLNFFLRKPVQDAGQWEIFRKLVVDVGILPEKELKYSVNHEDTHTMIAGLCQKLRYCAAYLRKSGSTGTEAAEREIYSMIDKCLGVPPDTFSFDGRVYTPRSFYQEYAAPFCDMDNISFISVSAPSRPFYHSYRVKWLYSGTEDGSCIRHYNIPLELFKEMAKAQLRRGMPVWTGADAEHASDKKEGIFDTGLYRFEELFGTSLELQRGEALLYNDSMMTHAMLLWGFSDDDSGWKYWCVRNSFGSGIGQDGYAYMSDAWFDRYVYQIVISREIASEFIDCGEADKAPVCMLDPWDAVGCLAQRTL